MKKVHCAIGFSMGAQQVKRETSRMAAQPALIDLTVVPPGGHVPRLRREVGNVDAREGLDSRTFSDLLCCVDPLGPASITNGLWPSRITYENASESDFVIACSRARKQL